METISLLFHISSSDYAIYWQAVKLNNKGIQDKCTGAFLRHAILRSINFNCRFVNFKRPAAIDITGPFGNIRKREALGDREGAWNRRDRRKS